MSTMSANQSMVLAIRLTKGWISSPKVVIVNITNNRSETENSESRLDDFIHSDHDRLMGGKTYQYPPPLYSGGPG